MKVKVGNEIYDGDIEPVMVILTDQDKKLICSMAPEATKYCCYPSKENSDEPIVFSEEYIKEWMKI